MENIERRATANIHPQKRREMTKAKACDSSTSMEIKFSAGALIYSSSNNSNQVCYVCSFRSKHV
eukprot:m.129758 g.129758  ORF g.129758 m.129758 type:complete len:64 (+) comp13051_c0_seq1:424-615(+)